MKKIILVFFFLIFSNQLTQAQLRYPAYDPNYDYWQGTWAVDGDKLNLELYSKWFVDLRFCSLNLYDDKNRKFNEMVGGDINIIVKPNVIVKKSIHAPHLIKEINKAKSLKLVDCSGPEADLKKEKNSISKTLDKIIGK
jgi:hypothetical protein